MQNYNLQKVLNKYFFNHLCWREVTVLLTWILKPNLNKTNNKSFTMFKHKLGIFERSMRMHKLLV